jgi:cell division protein FtsW
MSQALTHSPGFDAVSHRAGVARSSLRAGRVVLGVALGMSALGLVMVYSATVARGSGVGRAPDAAFIQQLRWVFVGALAGTACALAPLKLFRRVVVPAFVVALVLLVFVLVAPQVKGARRWIHLFGISIQPSELLKLVVVLYMAHRLALREEGGPFEMRTALPALLAPVGLGAILVLIEPDLGTSLFIAAEAVVLLALAGIRPTRVLPFAIGAIPLLLLYGYARFQHVRERIAGPGGQVEEALVAIGSGGLVGVGLGEGTQKLGYVAELKNDFIFALIGEELGFLGCAGVVIAFMALVFFGSRLAWNARLLGPHPYYLAAGAVFVIAFQALINIAVVTAVVPTKGISLPFVSKGGSNFIVLACAVGILVNVAHRTAAEAGEDPLG